MAMSISIRSLVHSLFLCLVNITWNCSAKIVFQTASSIFSVSRCDDASANEKKINLITFFFSLVLSGAFCAMNLMQNERNGEPIERRPGECVCLCAWLLVKTFNVLSNQILKRQDWQRCIRRTRHET